MQMGVDLVRVNDVLRFPEKSYPCSSRYPGRRVAAGDGLAVVFAEDDDTIVTVLWDGRDHR